MLRFRAALLTAAALIVLPCAGFAETVRPGDDFYRYTNGDWLRTTPLPAGRASYGTSNSLIDRNADRVRALIEEAAATPSDALRQKVGDYYSAFRDTAAIDARGMAPAADELAEIAAIGDVQALSAYLGGHMSVDDGTNTVTPGLFGIWVHQGFDQADHYVPHLLQGGLWLGDREAYLDTSDGARTRRDAYRAHVAAILNLTGVSDSDARAYSVVELEIAIAQSHASRADTDNVVKTNNGWRSGDFAARAPGIDWDAWFAAAGLQRQADFVVWQPSAITGISALVASRPLAVWKDYLTYHLIASYAAVLPKVVRDEDARFSGDTRLSAETATGEVLGEAIGQLYVARYFPLSAKAAAAAMTSNIRTAFAARIQALTWMTPQTKATALTKLATLEVGVGYPDHWIDYTGLVVARDDAYGNLRRARAFAYARSLARLSQPVDPGDWSTTPQSVSALINFSPNALQFSAGLLQPPYFGADGDAASNYGSAGAGMAHEISHTFDELGKIYDVQGRLVTWWTAEDTANYHAASAPLVAQYNAYCPQADLCVKGQQVLAENISDLAGLTIAHDAYLLSLQGKPDAVIDGLSGEQRFFLAYAGRWRKLQTDEALRRQIETDSHAPGEYRSDGVRNMDAWYAAFGIKPGDKLYLEPSQRIHVW